MTSTAAVSSASSPSDEPRTAKYEPRRREPVLTVAEFTVAAEPAAATGAGAEVEGGPASGQPLAVIAVAVNPYADLKDGRSAFNPHRATDAELLDRFEAAWYLQQHARHWSAVPADSPSVLIAVDVSADIADRYILGAVTIDQQGWGPALLNGPAITIPTIVTPHLDAHQLRGRRIELPFGHLPHEQFRIGNLTA